MLFGECDRLHWHPIFLYQNRSDSDIRTRKVEYGQPIKWIHTMSHLDDSTHVTNPTTEPWPQAARQVLGPRTPDVSPGCDSTGWMNNKFRRGAMFYYRRAARTPAPPQKGNRSVAATRHEIAALKKCRPAPVVSDTSSATRTLTPPAHRRSPRLKNGASKTGPW